MRSRIQDVIISTNLCKWKPSLFFDPDRLMSQIFIGQPVTASCLSYVARLNAIKYVTTFMCEFSQKPCFYPPPHM